MSEDKPLTNRDMKAKIKELIKKYPNDSDLGKAVRNLKDD